MPTFVAAKNTKVLYNSDDLSGYFNTASVPYTAEAVDTTTFGNDAMTRKGALKDASWSASGFLDESAGASGTALYNGLGAGGDEVSIWPEGDAIGKSGYGLTGVTSSAEISASAPGINEISAGGESSSAAERLVAVHAVGAETADGTASSSVNNGTFSLGGAAGFLHVTSIEGGTLTAKIQDSENDSSYADLITFSATDSATSERATVAGSVSQYARCTWTLTGGTATFLVGVGRTPKNI